MPPAQQRKLARSRLPSRAPRGAWYVGTQCPHALAPQERTAAAECIAKLCVGSFLATHGISSYCFSSPRLSLQSLCQGELHLLSSTPQLHRSHRGGLAAGKAAMWGLPVDFPLSFLHMESHQLAQRTPSTYSTYCRAQLPCPCYTDAGKTTSPHPLSKSSCCRDSSEVTETPQERSRAQGDSIATDSLFLPQPMK